MLQTLTKALKGRNLYGWEVTEEKTTGWEFYYIRHALDQNRAKDITEYTVKVYRLVEDGLGTASSKIPETASQEEVEKILDDLYYRASLVTNKPYPLKTSETAAETKKEPVDIAGIARDFLSVMQDLPETATEDINSYEIFISQKERHLVTSTGIDLTEVYPSSMIEVVVNARKDGHEIELYRNYRSGSCDQESLKEDLIRTFRVGKDRLQTENTPALSSYDLVLSTQDAINVYGYFLGRLDTSMVLRQMSDYTLGTPIATDITGDKVTLRAVRELPNSSRNQGFDSEGAMIRDQVLLDTATPVCYVGNQMFSSYLGVENTFIPTNLVVEGGKQPEAEVRQGDYLEVVEFSDFQVDDMTGDIFGEIRLGYLHREGEVQIVSGGSVSGSMNDFIKTMTFSEETVQYDHWVVPRVTRLKNATIAGVEE